MRPSPRSKTINNNVLMRLLAINVLNICLIMVQIHHNLQNDGHYLRKQ